MSPNKKVGAIRPDDFILAEWNETQVLPPNGIPGKIKITTFLGRSYQYVVSTPIGDFTVNKEMIAPYHTGQEVVLIIPKDQMVLVE